MTDPHDYAGKYLRDYEERRYSFVEKYLRFADPIRSILVPTNAEEFADVSFWQAGMDWDKYAQHARAVILRLGQNIWKDSEFESNYTEARRRHLAVGGYFFFDGRATPQQQANTIINAMAGKSLDMELFVDWEYNYGGMNEGLENAVKLMQLCEMVPCKAIGMYTGYYYFLEHSNATTHAAQYAYLRQSPLWLAWYAAASMVKVPPLWDTWTHWQYGTPVEDWGQPTAKLDRNKHNGTRDEFAARYTGETTIPPGGEMIETHKGIIQQDLNIRTGPGVGYPLNPSPGGMLKRNDTVYGVLDASNWFHFDRIARAAGGEESWDGWASAASVNYMIVSPYTPPQGSRHVVEVLLDGASVYRVELT